MIIEIVVLILFIICFCLSVYFIFSACQVYLFNHFLNSRYKNETKHGDYPLKVLMDGNYYLVDDSGKIIFACEDEGKEIVISLDPEYVKIETGNHAEVFFHETTYHFPRSAKFNFFKRYLVDHYSTVTLIIPEAE